MRNNRTDNNAMGFSLVELLITTAIIAILAALTLPSLLGSKRAAYEQTVKSKISAIGTAENTFRTALANRRYATIDEMKTTIAGGTPLLTEMDVTVTGWTISEIPSSITATTFGVRAVPDASNTADVSFTLFEDQVLRRCPKAGPWTRSCQSITE